MEDNSIGLDKPRNGLDGLKHWRQDLVAGLVVSLISLPFSLGIIIDSGAPPICWPISAIDAGLILPFIGGFYVHGERTGRRASACAARLDDLAGSK